MRIWDKELIEVLPRKQLLGQWRELRAIAGAIEKHGTPRHALVNKVLQFSYKDFLQYTNWIRQEMLVRGYKPSLSTYQEIEYLISKNKELFNNTVTNSFAKWHDLTYLQICVMNLQEKYDCGLITAEEWNKITTKFAWMAENNFKIRSN